MRFEQLLYLEAAIRNGAMRTAATELGVSQPTMSQQIQRLEEELDLVLLVRARTGVKPTDSAERLLPHIRNALTSRDLLLQEAQAIRGIHVGRVRIGAVPTALRLLLNQVLPEFRQRYPHVNLRVWEDHSEAVSGQVSDGLCDLGIIGRHRDTHPSWLDGLSVVDLIEEPVVLCLPPSHPLSERPTICTDDLIDAQWVAHGSGFTLSLVAQSLFNAPAPEPVFHSNDTATAIAMVTAGVGLAALPLSALAGYDERAIKVIRRISGTRQLPTLVLSMIRRENSASSPGTRRMSAMLRSRAADLRSGS